MTLPGDRRSLHALRTFIASTKALWQRKGKARELGATWSYTYRPADDADSAPMDIDVSEFEANPGDNYGHPRAGEYRARAVTVDGETVFDEAGTWNGDMSMSDTSAGDGEGGFAPTLKALQQATVSTLANAANAESMATRRAFQAETRAEHYRAELDIAIRAQDGLRKEIHNAEILRQTAEQARAEAEAQRDAALADVEEMKRAGGELKQPMEALVIKAYQMVCEHFGEEPIVVESDIEEKALRVACETVVKWLCGTWIVVPTEDGLGDRHAMVALVCHYSYGLPWPALRVAFHALFGVFLLDPPPLDWAPPPPPPADAGTGESTVH